MLGGSKLETSIGTCTIAMQYMNHMAKTTQNSPKASQNNARNMHGIELTHARMEGTKHDAYKANEEDYTTPTKTKHKMTLPIKIRVMACQNNTKNALRW